ncbi:MAG: hypothetical protein ACYTX0_38635 [Nostoc sp.]
MVNFTYPHWAASLIMDTKAKANYRVRNWKEYDAALKQRGSITCYAIFTPNQGTNPQVAY